MLLGSNNDSGDGSDESDCNNDGETTGNLRSGIISLMHEKNESVMTICLVRLSLQTSRATPFSRFTYQRITIIIMKNTIKSYFLNQYSNSL